MALLQSGKRFDKERCIIGTLKIGWAEESGHYSAYVSSGRVGHEGGDLLVRKTVEEINKMF